MKSNYDILGNHIRLIDTRNRESITDRVLGINIDKFFMPSVANVIGTDLSKYKLITKGKFACNPMHVGRDERLPVALYAEEGPAIVSPAYFMFEVIDNSILNEDYLMMWFRRPEFDRICWLHTDGSVRGGITWDDICRLELPIPPIENQLEIVNSYKAITERIALKQKINDNLQQQIRLLYNYWFTQFDFPDKNGNPYKSSGGTMVWSPIIHRDIPVYWKVTKLLDIVSWESNSQPPKSEFIYEPKDGYIRFIQNRDYDSDNHQTYIPYTKNLSTVDRFDILMDKYGDAGAVRYGIEGAFNVALGKINVNRPNFQEYIRSFLESDGVYSYLHNSCMASTRASLNESNLSMLNVVIPDEDTLSAFQLQIRKIRESILLTNDENLQLENLRNWLLPMLMNGQAVIQD